LFRHGRRADLDARRAFGVHPRAGRSRAGAHAARDGSRQRRQRSKIWSRGIVRSATSSAGA